MILIYLLHVVVVAVAVAVADVVADVVDVVCRGSGPINR